MFNGNLSITSIIIVTLYLIVNYNVNSQNSRSLNTHYNNTQYESDFPIFLHNLQMQDPTVNASSTCNINLIKYFLDFCPSLKDCYNCTAYYQDNINCQWTNGSCVANFQLYQSDQWWVIFNVCNSHSSNCGGDKSGTSQANETLSLPSVNGVFFQNNLYCEYTYIIPDNTQTIAFQYQAYTDTSLLLMTIEVHFVNGKTGYIMINDKKGFFYTGSSISNYTIHVYSEKNYNQLPFLLNISYVDTSSNTGSYLGLFISIPLLIILCITISICFYRCSRAIANKAALERNRNIIQQQGGNRNQIAVGINALDQAQINELLKTSNNIKIAEMIKKELRPVKYRESLNEHKNACTICLEEFLPESEVTLIYCKDIFHHVCLKDWLYKNLLHPKCPNCNYLIIDKENAKANESNNNSNISNNQIKNVPTNNATNRTNDRMIPHLNLNNI